MLTHMSSSYISPHLKIRTQAAHLNFKSFIQSILPLLDSAADKAMVQCVHDGVSTREHSISRLLYCVCVCTGPNDQQRISVQL